MRQEAYSHVELLMKMIEKEREEKAALAKEVSSLQQSVKKLEERLDSNAFLQEEAMQRMMAKICQDMMDQQTDHLLDSVGDLQSRVQITEELLPTVKAKVDSVGRTVEQVQSAAKASEADVGKVRSRLEEVVDKTSTFGQLSEATEEVLNALDIRLLSLELTSYNGVYIWKIPCYSQQTENARAGKELALISPPFYTSRHGYKMCARLYPDGDGMGKASHISVFFVIMKGEFDALLRWPFQQKVTITLLDQSPSAKHISDTFIPDPASNSFERPQSDMNIASGCPRFVPVDTVGPGRGYTKDDIMFLRIAVNTGGLINY